jgi:hypothetical protein
VNEKERKIEINVYKIDVVEMRKLINIKNISDFEFHNFVSLFVKLKPADYSFCFQTMKMHFKIQILIIGVSSKRLTKLKV